MSAANKKNAQEQTIFIVDDEPDVRAASAC